jgi:hypothetical protein
MEDAVTICRNGTNKLAARFATGGEGKTAASNSAIKLNISCKSEVRVPFVEFGSVARVEAPSGGAVA